MASSKSKPINRFGAVPRPLVQYKTGFPKQMKITHRYAEVKNLTFVAPNLNVVYYPYGTNCLYDPFLQIGGGQPLYFDQMTAIYNHYTVTASRIKVTFVPNTTDPVLCGIFIDDDATPAVTNLDTVLQQPSNVSVMIQRDVSAPVLRKYWSSKSVFGENPLDNDNLEGDATRNPTENQAFIIYQRPADSTVTVVMTLYIEMEFDTIWHELKNIAAS